MGSIAEDNQPTFMKPSFPGGSTTYEYAQSLDAKDHLRLFREKFIIPSKANIKSKKLAKPGITSVAPKYNAKALISIQDFQMSHAYTFAETL